ncbi:MAG: hypothetical protein L0332_10060 [Chloroflexi bacterium]|nr:hypothetical protein [Chloroflexota bacterium]MCI0649134.1 hypothetical protein [Chloroflexota bacterium]MCI0727049.1 hypothetical protein [Chloroflexota bacterium]
MITAVVMVGEGGGATQPVAWMRGARRAAAQDLLEQLSGQPLVERIILVSPEPLPVAMVDHVPSPPGPIHVGRRLATLVEEWTIDRLLYFGGGAAPLLDETALSNVVARLAAADQVVITNNQFASDWAGVTPASILSGWIERLPQDNMLGWVLSAEAGLPIHALPAATATRLDVDVPTDLLLLRLHPATRPHLRRYLAGLPLDTGRLERALAVLATPASQVFIAGRIGPEAWQALNRATRAWLRIVSEERGMVSSGRQARGEVYSLLADYIDMIGLEGFVATLSSQAQAAFLDTRVLLAHHGRWPSEADRFASDLGLVEEISHPWLRAFTAAVMAAPIPVILGGHGLMAGNLFAFCDLL